MLIGRENLRASGKNQWPGAVPESLIFSTAKGVYSLAWTEYLLQWIVCRFERPWCKTGVADGKARDGPFYCWHHEFEMEMALLGQANLGALQTGTVCHQCFSYQATGCHELAAGSCAGNLPQKWKEKKEILPLLSVHKERFSFITEPWWRTGRRWREVWPSGYDKDLVQALERDIVQRFPNVHWWAAVHGHFYPIRSKKTAVM